MFQVHFFLSRLQGFTVPASPPFLSPTNPNVNAHLCPSVDVGSKPHRFVPGRAPPHFTRNAGWVGGDAGLASVHVAVYFDGILHTALVWIHPVLPYKTTMRAIP